MNSERQRQRRQLVATLIDSGASYRQAARLLGVDVAVAHRLARAGRAERTS
jgi:hypothetical protein